MSIQSSVRESVRHLCSSEVEDMSAVLEHKCRIDSAEEASVESEGSSSKALRTPSSPRADRSSSEPSSHPPPALRRRTSDERLPESVDSTPPLASARVPASAPAPAATPLLLPRLSSAQSSPCTRTAPHALAPAPPPSRIRSPPPGSARSGGSPGTRAVVPARVPARVLALEPVPVPAPPTSPEHAEDEVVVTPLAPSPLSEPGPSVEEEQTCCICLEAYSTENPMFRGGCSHHFHLPCLLGWKQRSNTCPMCCAETLRGVGDIDDEPPAARRSSQPASPPLGHAQAPAPFVDDDEHIALELQRKYLRRAARMAEERLRAMAATPPATATPTATRQRSQAVSVGGTGPSRQRGPVLTASHGGPTSSQGRGAPSELTQRRTTRESASHRGKDVRSKGDCTVM